MVHVALTLPRRVWPVRRASCKSTRIRFGVPKRRTGDVHRGHAISQGVVDAQDRRGGDSGQLGYHIDAPQRSRAVKPLLEDARNRASQACLVRRLGDIAGDNVRAQINPGIHHQTARRRSRTIASTAPAPDPGGRQSKPERDPRSISPPSTITLHACPATVSLSNAKMLRSSADKRRTTCAAGEVAVLRLLIVGIPP